MTERFPPREERTARELHYYQYVPFILAVQMFCFMLPKMLASAMNLRTGNFNHELSGFIVIFRSCRPQNHYGR
jgi:hypothetical protein